MHYQRFVPVVLALALAPLLFGIINRTKAFFGGRKGPPPLQLYYDLAKLLRKGAVYSRTTSWIFRAGPIVSLAAIATATCLLPFGGSEALLHFDGDLILFAYLLGLARFFTASAALDTGSPFEGMGASREVMFSALAEPALLLGLAAIARVTNSLSLSDMHAAISPVTWQHAGLALALVSVALGVVFLTENSRIPVDDPNTHLELTMIHEVMVLDHGGPDFAMIMYGASLKMWLLGVLIIGLVLPADTGWYLADILIALLGMVALAIGVGVVESTMARLRMPRVPQLLVGAAALSSLALLLEFRIAG